MTVAFGDGSSTELEGLWIRRRGRPRSYSACRQWASKPDTTRFSATRSRSMGSTRYWQIFAEAGAVRSAPRDGCRSATREILELELPAIVESICEELGVDEIVVFGHSLGGQMGLLFAATSTRVSRVIVVASGSAWYRRMPGDAFGRAVPGTATRLRDDVARGDTCRRGFPSRDARRGESCVDWGFEAMTGRYRVSRQLGGLRKALCTSTVPALVVGVSRGPLVPSACTEHLARKLDTRRGSRGGRSPPRAAAPEDDASFRWLARPRPSWRPWPSTPSGCQAGRPTTMEAVMIDQQRALRSRHRRT